MWEEVKLRRTPVWVVKGKHKAYGCIYQEQMAPVEKKRTFWSGGTDQGE